MKKPTRASVAGKKPAAEPKPGPSVKRAPRERAKATSLELPEDGSIPDFLLVKNRKPLTPEQQAAFDARTRAAMNDDTRFDTRKPKGLSEEKWAEIQTEQAEERKGKAYARLARMHERKRQREAAAAERLEQRAAIAETGPQRLKKPPQEGSRKRMVYEALLKGGEAAALKKAATLDLKEGTARSWFGAWARQAAAERATAAPAAKTHKSPTAPTNGIVDRHPRTDGKRRVYLIDIGPDAQGTVTEEGPEQSVVRWDNGNEVTVINRWIADLPKSQQERI
jgi:hypothetical protein